MDGWEVTKKWSTRPYKSTDDQGWNGEPPPLITSLPAQQKGSEKREREKEKERANEYQSKSSPHYKGRA